MAVNTVHHRNTGGSIVGAVPTLKSLRAGHRAKTKSNQIGWANGDRRWVGWDFTIICSDATPGVGREVKVPAVVLDDMVMFTPLILGRRAVAFEIPDADLGRALFQDVSAMSGAGGLLHKTGLGRLRIQIHRDVFGEPEG